MITWGLTCHSRSPCSSHWNCRCYHRLHLNKGNRPSNLHQGQPPSRHPSLWSSCSSFFWFYISIGFPLIRGTTIFGNTHIFSCLIVFFSSYPSEALFYHKVHPLVFYVSFHCCSRPGPTSSQNKSFAIRTFRGLISSWPNVCGFWLQLHGYIPSLSGKPQGPPTATKSLSCCQLQVAGLSELPVDRSR